MNLGRTQSARFLAMIAAVALLWLVIVLLRRQDNAVSLASVSEAKSTTPIESRERAASEPVRIEGTMVEMASLSPQPSVRPLPTSKVRPTFVVAGATRLEETENDGHRHRLQYWKGRIEPPMTDWEAMGVLDAEGVPLGFTLPDGTNVLIVISRLERIGLGKGVFVATVEGSSHAEALFSYVNDSVSGVLRFPDEGLAWEIRSVDDGKQSFTQVDLTEQWNCGACQKGRATP